MPVINNPDHINIDPKVLAQICELACEISYSIGLVEATSELINNINEICAYTTDPTKSTK